MVEGSYVGLRKGVRNKYSKWAKEVAWTGAEGDLVKEPGSYYLGLLVFSSTHVPDSSGQVLISRVIG